eukprot:PITA_23991
MTKLFHVNIQVKKMKVDALFDSGSQETIIEVDLVKKLGMEVRDHPNPYPLGWVHKDVDLKKSQVKYKARNDQHITNKTFKVGDIVWLQLNKEKLQGLGKKIKDLGYAPFEILEKVGDNVYRINLPPYMHIYSVVNVENLKLYEPSMLDQEEEQVLHSVGNLAPDAKAKLIEDTVLQKRSRTKRQGKQDLWQIGLKGQLPGKAKWYTREKVEEIFPHLIQ